MFILNLIEFLSYLSNVGTTNPLNVPISPVLAGLTLTAAILFAIVCIVLAALYRKHVNK